MQQVEKKKKRKIYVRRCCFGFNLSDGVHGIVVWDNLYALFVITTSLSAVFYYNEQNRASQAFTDICSAALLIVRAVIGMITCSKGFQYIHMRKFFITRVVWDIALLIVNCIMVALEMMPVQTFFLNAFTLFLIDGYLNLVIYSYMVHSQLQALKKTRKKSGDQLDDFQIGPIVMEQEEPDLIQAHNSESCSKEVLSDHAINIDQILMQTGILKKPELEGTNLIENEMNLWDKANPDEIEQVLNRIQQNEGDNEDPGTPSHYDFRKQNSNVHLIGQRRNQKLNLDEQSSFVINYEIKKKELPKPIRKGKKEKNDLLQIKGQDSIQNQLKLNQPYDIGCKDKSDLHIFNSAGSFQRGVIQTITNLSNRLTGHHKKISGLIKHADSTEDQKY
ncbi:UNKNOWN [Stylonychia lemnae]|uniref:Transmembrane protein n=1 Tax=Stylonychia lemnae TaxID=5949 RepID=A0A077ZPG6_STYLE|nr:UNKNOWN [Stylonychia lemnae]|eukprot:CDW71329.1 UNKNOWN [Stylonychia lemnae]